MPDAPTLDISALDDVKLMDAADGLHEMYDQRVAFDKATDDIEVLHGKVTAEMRKRALLYTPLAKRVVPVPEPTDEVILKGLQPLDDAQRASHAEQGIALPDGSFPIPDEAHLHAAIRLVGQAADPQAAMQHIIERAKAMGLESALPPAWQVDTANPEAPMPQVGPGAHAMPGPASADPNAGKPSATTPASPAGPLTGGAPAAPAPGAPPAAPAAPKPGLMKRIASAVGKAMGAEFDEEAFTEALEANLDPDFDYAVVKARGEDQYTLGPIYMPNTYDAHGEWTTAEDLQKSVWDYVAETGGDRTVYLQHSPLPAGKWVEVMTWPHEVKAVMQKSINGVTKSEETVFPAGTAYMGVQWEDWAWDDVKKGKITGFSMGGSARRIEADIAE